MAMLTTNSNIPGIHFPLWDQMPSVMPVASAAGTCVCSDGARYIYVLYSATSFWRVCTWTGVPEQLANPTSGTVGAGTCMNYTTSIGALNNGVFYGAIFALITSGTGAPVFSKYDIASNLWTVLNVTNLPGTFGTDGYLCFPEPDDNNFEGGYHTNALSSVIITANVTVGATSITVTPLAKAIPSNTILNFGTASEPLLVHVVNTCLPNATSMSITPSACAITATAAAYYYDHIYLIGNASTQMYRFQISTSAWSTTSANSGNPALPVITAAVGAGCALRWLPGGTGYGGTIAIPDQLVIVRGGATNSMYRFDLQLNTMSALPYAPATETFTTGSSTMVCKVGGKKAKLIITKEVTMRFFRIDFAKQRKEPISFQELITSGAALVGDRTCIIKQAGVDMIYVILGTSAYMLRSAILV